MIFAEVLFQAHTRLKIRRHSVLFRNITSQGFDGEIWSSLNFLRFKRPY